MSDAYVQAANSQKATDAALPTDSHDPKEQDANAAITPIDSALQELDQRHCRGS